MFLIEIYIHLHCWLVNTDHGKVLFGSGVYNWKLLFIRYILEVALIAEESETTFHCYVSLHYSVPKRVQQLTGITNKTTKSLGLPFREVMDGLVDFLHHEQVKLLSPLLLHMVDIHTIPLSFLQIVWNTIMILRVLQNRGYNRPGLDALCNDLNMKRNGHSALEDAENLMTICESKSEIFNRQYGFTFEIILYHLDKKLPLPIQMVYNLAVGCSSHQLLLYEYVKPKTELNLNKVCWVCTYYFIDRFIYCK